MLPSRDWSAFADPVSFAGNSADGFLQTPRRRSGFAVSRRMLPEA
ncbi:MAG: hypothetical protein AAGB34_04625 [Planctomycetota bacterium]